MLPGESEARANRRGRRGEQILEYALSDGLTAQLFAHGQLAKKIPATPTRDFQQRQIDQPGRASGIDQRAEPPRRRLADRLARHDVIVLHVMDHDELEFPFENNTLFEGLEAPDIQLLTDPQSLRTSYLGIVQNFITKVRSACVNHRIDYCLLSTHDPLDAGLAAYLAGRMHRLTK